ncbi:MAG: CBS domain-containing protein [Anaerolineaceae bacterium]|jgi:CBS domain-containing protein
MKKSLVSNWMSSDVVTVTPETPVVIARKVMSAKHIRTLPVVDDENLVGIVTRRGLLRIDYPPHMDTADLPSEKTHDILVGEIMTKNPITILPNEPLSKAAYVMWENKITALPVLTEDGKLVGILTSSDVFRAIIEELPCLPEHIAVNTYMTTALITITPDTALIEARRLMAVNRIRALPVLDDTRLVGILTRTDLMAASWPRRFDRDDDEHFWKIELEHVERIMTTNVITIDETANIIEAARLMLVNKIHALPVVDTEGGLTGIITESDLFRMVVQKLFP